MSLQEHENVYWVYVLLICSEQYIQVISSSKKCSLFSSAFKKIILNNTTHTFQEEGGVTQPLIFRRWHRNFSWYCVNHHQVEWFLHSGYFYVFVCHYFHLKWSRKSTHNAPWEDFQDLSFLCSGLQHFFWVQYKEQKVCLTKIPKQSIFKVQSAIYFQNMCIATCDI